MVVDKTRQLVAIHRDKFVFPVSLTVKKARPVAETLELLASTIVRGSL